MKTIKSNSAGSFTIPHQELIEGCKKGDQKAQFQLYKLYYKAMYNTSLRIVRDAMEAEDIMQESFLTAFEKIDTYSGSASFGAWLKKIVINRSLDLLRKKGNIVFENIESIHETFDEHIDNIYQNEYTDLSKEKIVGTINMLPARSRIIISLYLFEGYSHDEISELLSISRNTSRSQLSRAKHKIIRNLNG